MGEGLLNCHIDFVIISLYNLNAKLTKDEGKIEWAKNVRAGYLDQHTVLTKGMTIKDILSSAFDFLFEMEVQMNKICDKMGSFSEEELENYMEDLGTIQELLTILDEPTNYLDAEHSHDIPFLSSVINLIYHMNHQQLHRYPEDYDKFQEFVLLLPNVVLPPDTLKAR